MRTSSIHNFPKLRLAAYRTLMAGIFSVISVHASAGIVTFNLSLSGSKLTVTQQGESSAYYPVALRLLPDGRWQPLAIAPGEVAPAELATGAQLDFVWPEVRPLASLAPFERIQPMMIRFFDQAGVNLGQISFFNPPPPASETLKADYATGQLEITPPADNTSSIRSSWLLWSQEDGIVPIRNPVKFDRYQQSSAQHIEWRSGMKKLRVDTGAGQPEAFLLHETAQGFTLQSLPDGGRRNNQQRSAWLDAGEWFYGASATAAALAVLMVLLHFVRTRRRGGQA